MDKQNMQVSKYTRGRMNSGVMKYASMLRRRLCYEENQICSNKNVIKLPNSRTLVLSGSVTTGFVLLVKVKEMAELRPGLAPSQLCLSKRTVA